MRDAMGHRGRVAVLGGTSEIGLAITERLVRERDVDHVVLAGRDVGACEQAGAPLEALGADVRATRFDAHDLDGHADVVDALFADGDVDVVVLAFGVLGDQQQSEADAAHAVDVVQTNFTAAVSVLVPLAQRLRAQGHGDLVVLSSVAAVQARPDNFTYGASKAGLDAFALGLGDSLAGSGARVLVVRPGFVHSRMTAGMEPAPLATDPQTVAETVVGALDGPSRSVVWVPRAVGAVGKALRVLPRALIRRLPS